MSEVPPCRAKHHVRRDHKSSFYDSRMTGITPLFFTFDEIVFSQKELETFYDQILPAKVAKSWKRQEKVRLEEGSYLRLIDLCITQL